MKAYIVQPGRIFGARAVRIKDAIARMPNAFGLVKEDGEWMIRWFVRRPGAKQWGIETLRSDGRWHLAAYLWEDATDQGGYHWHEFATEAEAADAARKMMLQFGQPPEVAA